MNNFHQKVLLEMDDSLADRVQEKKVYSTILKAAVRYYFVFERIQKEIKSRLQAESKQLYAYKQDVFVSFILFLE